MNLPTTRPNDRELSWYMDECFSLQGKISQLEREKEALQNALAAEKHIRRNVEEATTIALKRRSQAIKERDAAKRENWSLNKIITEQIAFHKKALSDRELLDSGTILLTVAGERVVHSGVNLRKAIAAGIAEGNA